MSLRLWQEIQAMSRQTIIEVAVALIINDEGRVLITKRPPGVVYAEHWEFPGGKIEKGESAEHALAREIREEVNLEIKSARFINTFYDELPGKTIALHVFWVERYSGQAQLSENQMDLMWAECACMEQLSFPPANKHIIAIIPELA